jgi:hypothetical protein
VSKNVKGLHVLFMPEVKKDGNGQRQKTFISGCNVQEVPKNSVDTTKPQSDENASNGTGNGGNTSNGSGSGNTGGNGNTGGDSSDGDFN